MGYGPHVGRQFKGVGIKELRKVHAYRKELFSKEDSERAEKTKGQSVTFNVKKE